MFGLFRRVRETTVEELRRRREEGSEEDFTLPDVREPAEYEARHLPGAVHLPLSGLADRLGELDRSKAVITYCTSGRRSRSAASLLSGQGFPEVTSLAGGVEAWQGVVATGEYSHGMDFLEATRRAEDILPLALAFEEGTRRFHAAAGDLVDDPEAGKTFAALVKAEERHKGKLTAARAVLGSGAGCEMPTGEERLRGFMEGAAGIDEAVAWARSKREHPSEILELAMQMEANSLDYYLKVAARKEFAPVKEVLAELVADEKEHLARLAALLERNV